ncbi:MAG TPA: DUF945 family protein [Gammaproteobacteria bacterium]|nr:DUF945 family protein [Gammaproteobacteria bacterium]
MNKLAIVAAALLVVALLVAPWLVGSITEARVRERVAAIDASPTATAEVKSFDRGWFRSTAKIELSLVPDNVAQLADVTANLGPFAKLPIAIEFGHGPIAVLDGVHFGWSKLVARPDTEAPGVTELQQTLGVPYLFEFRGRSSYTGRLRFDADSPPFTLPIDEALLTFSGATLAGTFARQHLDADANISAVEFAWATGSFAIRGLFATADNELRQYVMPGKGSLSIESIQASDTTQGTAPLFEAKNLKIQSDVALDAAQELAAMRLDYGLDSARVDDTEVTAAALGVAVRNVDVAALEAYGAAATDAAAAGADPSTIKAALGPHLERALKAGPSLTLDPLRFRYDDEPFEGRLEITTNTQRLPPAGTLDLDNPLLMLGLVNADAEVRVSKPLGAELAKLAARLQLGADPSISPDQLEYMAEAQSGLMLTMLVGQGVLLEDGDGYRSSVQFRDGAVTLNGNVLPFGL